MKRARRLKPGILGKGLAALGLAVLLSGCAHLYQACNEVLVREPGTRTDDDSQARPVKAWAEETWKLAALSNVVFIENHSMDILAEGLRKAKDGQGDCSR